MLNKKSNTHKMRGAFKAILPQFRFANNRGSRLLHGCAFLVILVLCTFPFQLHAQDLEDIPDSLFVKFNGGINAGMQLYTSSGMESRRDPFSYLISANLVINISDVISMPFSATFSSGSHTYSQPKYNIVGASPKYKAVTLHVGYRNMQFSSYTLNGISFLGGGVEVAPENAIWKVKLMSGRLAKGISFKDDVTGKYEMPSYQRWGWGGMVTLGNKDYSADLILFKATDDHHSVDIPDSLNVTPKENLTFGINTKLKLFENLQLTTEYAGSAYTEDTRMDEVVYDRYTYLNNLGNLFVPRLSSSYSNAYAINASWGFDKFSIGLGFRRVDPNYATLGSTYISNDYQNSTITLSKTLLKEKINLSGNYGLQRNNLDGDKEQTTKKVIGAFQGTYNINETWNLTANYSNYSTESNPTYINLVDSVRYVQVAKSYGGTVSYSRGSETWSHSIMLNLMAQNSDMLNNTATKVTHSNTTSSTGQLSYSASNQPLKLSISTSFNATLFEMEGSQTTTMGPVISLQRPFLNRKISTTLSASRMMNWSNESNSSTSVVRLNASYKVFPKQTIKLTASTTFLNRPGNAMETGGTAREKSTETKISVNYSLNF